MSEAQEPRLSYADYLLAEQVGDTKHDFVAGEAFAMAGGSVEHQRVASQMLGELYGLLRGGPCRVVNSDQRIRIAVADLACYPDVTVICGPDARAEDDPHALTNPKVVVEVLSPPTEGYDRGTKFAALRELPSFEHFVLLYPDRSPAECFTRRPDGSWHLTFHTDRLPLAAIDVEVDLAAVYEGIP